MVKDGGKVMRQGEKWFYEVSEFFSTLTNIENVSYCGFRWVTIGQRCFNSGIFEFDKSVVFDKNFVESIQGYSSNFVLCMNTYEVLDSYRHCVVVVLR